MGSWRYTNAVRIMNERVYDSISTIFQLYCHSVEFPDRVLSSGMTVTHRVAEQARPLRMLETGSAQKTPSTPRPHSFGKMKVRGTTTMTLRNKEKKIACLERPKAKKVFCPAKCSDIKSTPKK